jgi:hypothetical protein
VYEFSAHLVELLNPPSKIHFHRLYVFSGHSLKMKQDKWELIKVGGEYEKFLQNVWKSVFMCNDIQILSHWTFFVDEKPLYFMQSLKFLGEFNIST